MKRLYFAAVLSLFAVKIYGAHNMLINGSTSATVFADTTFELTFSFESSGAEAKGIIYLDANENGQLNPTDPWIYKIKLIDGNFNDEDETQDSDYREICEPFKFSGKFLFYAEDNGVSDTAALTVNKVTSSYSVSGSVNPPANQANILVCLIKIIDQTSGAYDQGYGDFTDNTGAYSIGIPNSDANLWWSVVVLDNAMAATQYGSNNPVVDTVLINGHKTINLAMRSVLPDTTTIWGVLRDDANTPITDPAYLIGFATTWGGFENLVRPWKTDNNGAYRIPLKRATAVIGWGYMASGATATQFYGEYMNPNLLQQSGPGSSPPQLNLNLKAYRTNATISGRVYKEGAPYDKCELYCKADSFGDNSTRTYSDGRYEMPVSNVPSQYSVKITRKSIPEGYKPVPDAYNNVTPGATGIDFNLVGVEETSKLERLSLMVYPNPFMSKVVFTLSGSRDANNLVIHNLAGKYVAEIKPETNDKGTRFVLSRKLPVGVYFYSLKVGGEVFKGKIVKLQ